ncbi:flagellar assembly protein A [Desulfurispira natronophila]|uniref:Flagellar Assembly Protein A N-terminal region domain-containing protein n=1 Tax=Desulfurispira natronophila TaxID=682562 RepID=A0A7W7Y4C0_9BACT|nr:flagellar assembly protein A [Desulfurispira natronophila]MBB5021853.1 hypothetical protein [Desulfurispira natronophila]
MTKPAEKVLGTYSTEDVSGTLERLAESFRVVMRELDFTVVDETEPYSLSEHQMMKSWRIRVVQCPGRSTPPLHMSVVPDDQDSLRYHLRFFRRSFVDPSDSKPLVTIEQEIYKTLALHKIVYGVIGQGGIRRMCLEILNEMQNPPKNPQQPYIDFPIAYGQKLIHGQDSRIQYNFDRYNPVGKLRSDGSLDYSRKDFTQYVHANKVIMIHYLPVQGQPGISPTGKVRPQHIGQDIERFPFRTTSRNIKLIHRAGRVEVLTRKEGYFVIDHNSWADIVDNLEIEGEVNIGVTGDIYFDERRKDVRIVYDGVEEDAVGSGRSVEGENIYIKGNIASHAKIKGKQVEIVGSIHSTAVIEGEEYVRLAMGGGHVKAPTVEAKSFQSGNIVADKIHIWGNMINTKVFCQEIEHTGTMRNTTITAAGPEIILGHLAGGDNMICVDYHGVPSVEQKIEKLEQEQAKLELSMAKLSKEVRTLSADIKRDKPQLETTVARVNQLRKEGRTVPESQLKFINSFRHRKKNLEQAALQVEEDKKRSVQLKREREKLLEVTRNAVVRITQGVEHGNRVRFLGQSTSHELAAAKNAVMIEYSQSGTVKVHHG